MDIACTGRYIVTCSTANDLVIWDLKGQILANVDTYLGTTHKARVSPCGRFVAASGKLLSSTWEKFKQNLKTPQN